MPKLLFESDRNDKDENCAIIFLYLKQNSYVLS